MDKDGKETRMVTLTTGQRRPGAVEGLSPPLERISFVPFALKPLKKIKTDPRVFKPERKSGKLSSCSWSLNRLFYRTNRLQDALLTIHTRLEDALDKKRAKRSVSRLRFGTPAVKTGTRPRNRRRQTPRL